METLDLSSRSCTHARSSQFAVDMSTHRIPDCFYILCDPIFATLAKASRIGSQRRKRSLESVGKIGCSTTGALNLLLLRVDQ